MRRTLLPLLIASTVLLAGCWQQEGFDATRSGFAGSESTLTTANVASLARAWVIDVGATATAPVVMGDKLYEASGSLVGGYDVLNGSVRWQTTMTGIELGTLTGFDTTVVAPGNQPGQGGLVTFDVHTGQPTTNFVADATALTPPAVRGSITASVSTLTLGSSSYTILSYGNLKAALPGAPALPAPTIIDQRVLVSVGSSVLAFDHGNCLTAGAPPGFCLPNWTTNLGSTVTHPAGAGGSGIAVGTADGRVVLLDVATGAVVFTALTGSTAATTPAVAKGVLVSGAADGRARAFPAAGCGAATCAPTWTGLPVGAAFVDQAAVGADVAYLGTADGRVFAFGLNGCGTPTCPVRWSGTLGDGAVTGLVVDAGALYASTDTGKVAGFRLPA